MSIFESCGELLTASVDLNKSLVQLTLGNAMKVLISYHYKVVLFASFLMVSLVLTPSFIHPSLCDDSDLVKKELSLSFLENVVKLNLSENVVLHSNVIESTRSVFPHNQTDVRFYLSHGDSVLDGCITFIDGKFSYYWISSFANRFSWNKTLDDNLLTACCAIRRYQELFNATYCSEVYSMISTALENQLLRVENEHAILEISHVENCSTPLDYERCTIIRWFRKIDNQYTTESQKISMYLSKDGLLTRFHDYLAAYYVASTNVNISESEAIEIAMPYAETYANQHAQSVNTTHAYLEWNRDIDALRGDTCAIYPAWYVEMWYNNTENGVSGYGVTVWADNGQVASHSAKGHFTSEANFNVPFQEIVIMLIVVPAIPVSVGVYLRFKRKRKPPVAADA